MKGKAIIACFAVLVGLTLAERTYVITAPKNVRPKTPYQVVVSIHNSPETVRVLANVSCTKDGSSVPTYEVTGEISLGNGDTKIMPLEIGDWKEGSCRLSVEGKEGIIFDRSTSLGFNRKLFSLFAQTDKAIYQPGQLVQFRILAVDSNLKPINSENLQVYMQDAQGNRIKQWNNATVDKGLFSAKLQLSEQPVLGDWSINANLGDEQLSKQFTVAEYVLPKFEVTVRPPPFGTFNDTDIVVTVDAKYTYGKPVKGKVVLNATESYCRNSYNHYCGTTPVVVTSKIDGSTDVRIPVSQFNFPEYSRYQATLDFLATVTEELTGREMNGSAETNLYAQREKIDISQSSSSFKPGLRHTFTVKLQLQDGTPIINATEKLIVKSQTSYSNAEEVSNYTVPMSGIIDVDVYPNEDSEFVRVSAEYKNIQNSQSARKAQSISSKYLQLGLNKTNPKVGDVVDITVNGTFYITRLDYEVVSRGKVITSGSANYTTDAKFQTIPLTLTQDMAPRARVVAYFISSCGEVVTDTMDFSVDGLFLTPVALSTSENITKPGAPIKVTVDTLPNALVGLLAIDQSVLLLKSGNDISKSQVISDMDNYESGWRPSNYDRKRRSIWRPPGETVPDLFSNAGLVFFSNGLFSKSNDFGYGPYPVRVGLGSFGGASFNAAAAPAPPPMMQKESSFDGANVAATPKVRKEFPETWIWQAANASENGKAELETTVPDTITSWVISAFALDGEKGLGLADGPAKVQVFRPFFVSLNLPYSIVRGETVNIQAIVFNYMKEDVEVDVTLDNSKGEFELTGLQNRVDAKDNATSETKHVKVKAGDGTSVFFLVTPTKVGHVDIKVTGKAATAGDALIRKLLVKAEGSPQYFNKPLLIDLRNTSDFSSKVHIDIPDFAVPDSEHIEVSAIGDIMGPTVNNLDKLIRMPYGCGEQNMVNFVPNIVVSDYLTTTGQMTDEIKNKALKYMESGYQRELTYKRNDGSFSAFGNSDKEGSTWLTAFVVRSFIQAKPYISVDNNVIESGLKFLADRQDGNGTFVEKGEVHSKSLQGGSSSGLGLTAYVLLAFLEAKDNPLSANVTKQALKYIEEEIDTLEDPYELAIATYVLQAANSSAKDAAFEKFLKKAEKKGDRVFWSKPQPEKPVNVSYWYVPPPSVDIEMTSYALLTYLLKGNVPDSIPIMRWLIGQRNENGGFASTQDTVVGIAALAKMASHITSPPDSKMTIAANYDGRKKEFTLERANAMVLQREEIPESVRNMEVTAKGNGVGIVQVTWSYNIDNETTSTSFQITPTVKRIDNDTFDVKVCALYEEDDDKSNMAVIEVNMPSGYVVDSESLPTANDFKTLKRVDSANGGSKVELYFDYIDHVPVCPHVKAFKAFEVANIKPATASVYDYYENDRRAETFYDPPVSSLCDICTGDECAKNCKK